MNEPHPDELAHTLVQAALIGTTRQEFTMPSVEGELGKFLARINGSNSQDTLLRAAAILFLYRRVGHLPAHTELLLPQTAGPEMLAPCPPRAESFLLRMVTNQYTDVLPEFLDLLAKHQQRVPAEMLPPLLERARLDLSLCPHLAPVLGTRGVWLAAQNADWNFVSDPTADESVWDTGSRDERAAFLEHERGADSARARERLSLSWSQEAPADRAGFLGTFGTGLTVEDEPFLENALNDKRQEVRRVAVDLLAKLPDSNLVRRMMTRTQPLIEYRPKRLGRDEIQVTLPEDCDKAMQRDGIEPKSPDKEMGNKAWWLKQMLGYIPPQLWCEKWHIGAEKIIKVASKHEWERVLLEGWRDAAARFRDREWARALLEVYPRSPALLLVLDPEAREKFIVGRLQNAYGEHEADLEYLPRVLDLRERVVLSRLAVRVLYERLVQTKGLAEMALAATLKTFGLSVAPSLYPEIEKDWSVPVIAERNSKGIQTFLRTLHFRYEMYRAFET